MQGSSGAKNCITLSPDVRSIDILSGCLNSLKPEVVTATVTIREDHTIKTSDSFTITIIIAETVRLIPKEVEKVMELLPQDVIVPDAPMEEILNRWSPPVKTWKPAQFVPPLILQVVDVTQTGKLSLAFNRPVEFNLAFFQQFKIIQ